MPIPGLRPKNPNGGSRGLSEEQLIEALKKNGGNILAASQALGVTDSAIYQRLCNHPELKAIQEEAAHKVTQLATAKVIKRIERDDWPAINLWLRTQAGWRERQEHTGPDGKPIQVSKRVRVTVRYVGGKDDAPEEDVI